MVSQECQSTYSTIAFFRMLQRLWRYMRHLSERCGEWNEMKIRVVGNQVTTVLNGQQMISLKDDKIGAATGQIALQIHDGGGIKVKWKDLRVKKL